MTSPTSNLNYDQRITNLFISVMGIVTTRRKLQKMQDDLLVGIERAGVDKRILDALENEFERRLEEPEYKMRPVSWIREDIRRVDNGEEIQFWEGKK